MKRVLHKGKRCDTLLEVNFIYAYIMSAVFFQSIGKSVRAVVTSLVRDIVCFTPLAILLLYLLEKKQAGSGIHGIL